MSKPPGDPPDDAIKIPDVLPVLPLKDTVIFPYIILPLSVGRDKSVLAVDRALAESRVIMLVAQRDAATDNPGEADLYPLGTAAVIMRMLKLPDGRIRILVQGLARAKVEHISQMDPYLQAKIERIEEPPVGERSLEIEALIRSVKESLDRAVTLGKGISPEVMVIAANLEDAGRLADLAASNLDLKIDEAQGVLETIHPVDRLRKVSELLAREIQVLTMQQEISSQARGEMDRSQREYFLRQQLKAIQQELGEGEELSEEIANYRKLAEDRKISDEGKEELERQVKRLERSHPESAETQIIRTYLDWLTALPWQTLSEDNLDLDHAQQVLDEDHYDLEKIKERILEYLAVRKLKQDTKGPILCFVGPPGVGKTSLGRSIARSLGRQFVRISLGGVRDEAEIRGHRRTYVGALPGRILQGIRQAGTSNPVFVLDEIDKIGADYRGDPSSALLEVLDPEQNWSFVDHYLGLSYDLSRVMFIATANLLEPVQPAFLDRMEVIRLSGYTEEEKLRIARAHLIPKQVKENGIDESKIDFTDDGIKKLISGYTKEAGLRNLERELAAICRKVAVQVARGQEGQTAIDPAKVEELLGPAKHFSEELLDRDRVGVATGLAWTAVGGDLLFIEVVAVPGKGQLLLTGQLGDVMKESAQAALSYARAYAGGMGSTGIAEDYFAKHDIHVHVPAGSIPKDGPSAGITIGTAILSVLANRPINRRVAMTGEITLRGDVLPIGGLKEKVLAAKLAGVHTVIVPKLNRRDLVEIPETIKKDLTFHFVDHMDEVLKIALLENDLPATPATPATIESERQVAPV
ncbi:MAG TPA: endopeptidase La [Thermoanaerobaculia bacterium]|nr:endopeptidase La [Thermoanaerobaculia bacterium]